MSDGPIATAYSRLLDELEGRIKHDYAWPSPESGFATYVFHRAGELGPAPAAQSLSWPASDRLVHAPSLAAAGYLVACGQGNTVRDAWFAGMMRLKERDAFPTDRQSFAFRPVELLGISTGTAAYNDPDLTRWNLKVLERSRKEHAGDPWSHLMQVAAELILGQKQALQSEFKTELALAPAALLRWICTALAGEPPSKELDAFILESALLSTAASSDLASSSILYQSVRQATSRFIASQVEQHWQIGKHRRNAEELVVTLCRRFHLFATQLLVRHGGRETVQIKDEYDVQDLMHALLQFHFDDVRAEEVSPSVGGKSGRMDFLLKSEQMVVETKMTRKSLNQKDVGDELIVDMKRYRSHPDYRTLVCLVYDPGGFCHAPAALENDLTSQDGDFRNVVVVCPKGL